jgi:gamma-butyrobetaine dioxygenase
MKTTRDHPALRGLAAVWLRVNCPCARCRDPRSGQRLAAITDVPADVAVDEVSVSGDIVEVIFGPDGHRASFDRRWLAEYGPFGGSAAPDGRTEAAKRLWTAGDISADLPRGHWPKYLASPGHRRECLHGLMSAGFVLLHDVPPEPGLVLDVAASLGFVRETNYGRLFDVRVEPAPGNLAFTALPITPHTDNPYRDPVPTVQLLHCLTAADEGGNTGLVDGFMAARLLRTENPAAFSLLARTPVQFRYADATAELTATRPVIGLDPIGRIREIRFNHRSLQPVRLAPREAGSYYAAYRAFAVLLTRPELMLSFRLAPGDCLVFDNTRIMHARTGFAATGPRHLQGCYADLDGVASALAVLRRDQRPAGHSQEEQDEPDQPG